MSHRASKSKSRTQPRTQFQSNQPASIPSNSSNLFGPSAISNFEEIMPINAAANEALAFIAGPGATTFQPPISLAQLVANAKSHPAPTWPINDLLPEGLCLLAAKPHAGSRSLALQLGLSIARGTSALDHFPTTSGEVLYLSFHDTQNTILSYTQNLLGKETMPTQLSWSNTWQDWQQDGLDALNSWLDAHPNTRLLVIDSFSHLLPPGTSTKQAYKLLRQLNHLAHTHHLCILLLHSLSRVSSKDPFSSIPCSPLLLETCTSLAVLDHNRATTQATLHLTGSILPTRTLPLSLHTSTSHWSLDTSSNENSLSTSTLTPPHENSPLTTIQTHSFAELLASFMPPSLPDLALDNTLITEIQTNESPVTPTPSTPFLGGRKPTTQTSNAPVTLPNIS